MEGLTYQGTLCNDNSAPQKNDDTIFSLTRIRVDRIHRLYDREFENSDFLRSLARIIGALSRPQNCVTRARDVQTKRRRMAYGRPTNWARNRKLRHRVCFIRTWHKQRLNPQLQSLARYATGYRVWHTRPLIFERAVSLAMSGRTVREYMYIYVYITWTGPFP